MTPRRVRVLLDRLPSDSATKTALRDAMTDEELAAYSKTHQPVGHGALTRTDLVLFDIKDALAWLFYATYHAQGGKPTKPTPTPRPGLVDPGKKTVTPLNAQGLAHLRQLRNRAGD